MALLDNITQETLDQQTSGLLAIGLYIFKIGKVEDIKARNTQSQAVRISLNAKFRIVKEEAPEDNTNAKATYSHEETFGNTNIAFWIVGKAGAVNEVGINQLLAFCSSASRITEVAELKQRYNADTVSELAMKVGQLEGQFMKATVEHTLSDSYTDSEGNPIKQANIKYFKQLLPSEEELVAEVTPF